MKAQAVSGETKKRELARILAAYERGDIDVLVNAQLLAEGWNSPRATVCMHLAPTASKRIYQQRVGRVTRRHPGKEAGIVVDFVHPATKHDDPVVTLHSLLDRDVYRGGAIVVGPVRRGRGRRLRVERRVVPVTADENRRIEVFERELWRIAVEHLDYGEQVQWAALAGARVAPAGWRRARAMLHFDEGGELKRAFLLTAVERNKNPQLRLRALQEIAASRDAEAFDRAIEMIAGWPREEKREGVKVVLQSLAEKKIGRRDQANDWIWACAEMTREVHEEYAVQRWPETKRLLGLLVNSSGGAHARNARRLVHAARQQDRRLAAALLAAALPHTAEAGEVVNGARTRMSRKPAALARELLRNFPKGKGRRGQRRRKKGKGGEGGQVEALEAVGADARRWSRGDRGGVGRAAAAAALARRHRGWRVALAARPLARGQARRSWRRRARAGGRRGDRERGAPQTVERGRRRRGEAEAGPLACEACGGDAGDRRSRGEAQAGSLACGEGCGGRRRRRGRPEARRRVREAADAAPRTARSRRSRSARSRAQARGGDAGGRRGRGEAQAGSLAWRAASKAAATETKPGRARSRAAKPADATPENGAVEEKPKPARARAAASKSAADKPKPARARAAASKSAADKPKRARARATKQDADRGRGDRGGGRGEPAPSRAVEGAAEDNGAGTRSSARPSGSATRSATRARRRSRLSDAAVGLTPARCRARRSARSRHESSV